MADPARPSQKNWPDPGQKILTRTYHYPPPFKLQLYGFAFFASQCCIFCIAIRFYIYSNYTKKKNDCFISSAILYFLSWIKITCAFTSSKSFQTGCCCMSFLSCKVSYSKQTAEFSFLHLLLPPFQVYLSLRGSTIFTWSVFLIKTVSWSYPLSTKSI